MFSLPGYRIHESIYRSTHTTVFRAQRETDSQAVIIKLYHSGDSGDESLLRAQRESLLLENLDSPNLPDLLDCLSAEQGHALVIDDCGGRPVDQLLEEQALGVDDLLRIAIGATEALGVLHERGITHRDVRPSNLIYNQATGAVQLIDLDQATRLAQEAVSRPNPAGLIGHPDYVAPEQTGRLSRSIDYRSDFYSLGASLFHLYTGQAPFSAGDTAGLLHAHIARKPPLASDLRADLPNGLSAILNKLLNKSPDDRYQSAYGLQADLRHIETLPPDQASLFVPGSQDVSGHFRILNHLYGRETELARLRADYRAVREGSSRLTLVTGGAGIGKTALVEALREHVIEDEGYFVTGKFDQLKRNEPYFGPIKALTSLVGHILSEDDAQVALWRKHILDTMGDTCAALAGLIPELKAVTGVLPAASQVAGSEAMHRFNAAVRLLLKAISTFGKPVVLFLDDLQWADTPSLRTINHMLREAELAHIHVIGAYRDEAMQADHPVNLLLETLSEQNIAHSHLQLAPLRPGDIGQLLADSLTQEVASCAELAELLHARTGGNPFFVRQMLTHLYKQNLFSFDTQAGRWQWSLTPIAEAGLTSDVAEFMAGQLQALSEAQLNLLQIAACIGTEFRLEVLSQAAECLHVDAARLLTGPLEKGLISMSGLDSGLLLIQETAALEQLLGRHDVRFRFNHDRIQAAADQLLDDQRRTELHLRLARLLKKQSIPDHDSHRLFNLVSHYNRAIPLLAADERRELAELNLRAGIAIKRSGAHDVAYRITQHGLNLLAENAWTEDYRLCLDLHLESAELACLTADYTVMQEILAVIESGGHSAVDKLPAYETRILAEIARNRPYKAVQTAIPLLRQFGLHLPEKPGPAHVMRSYLKTRLLLAGKPLHKLQSLPTLADPNYQAGVQLLSRVVSAAYFSSPLMLPLIILLLVRISLRHGLSPMSPFAFVGYGALLCGAGRKPLLGHQYGELGLRMARNADYGQFTNRAQFLFGHYTEHWTQPVQETCLTLQTAFEASLQAGDQEFTAYPAALYCMHSYFAGKNLLHLKDDMRELGAAIGKTQHETVLRWHQIYQAAVDNLSREDGETTQLQTPHCDEQSVEQLTASAKDAGVGFHYSLNKMMLCYLFRDYEQAERYRRRAAKDLPFLVATPYIPVYHQYAALLALARYREHADAALLRQAHRSHLLMRRWAQDCEANYAHKAWLIEAEMAYSQGQNGDAMDAYERAMDGARQYGFVQDEALARELAGEMSLQTGREAQALYFLQGAVEAHRRWGALRKVTDIQARHPQVAEALSYRRNPEEFDPRIVDVQSVIKAARALSGEIVLPRLIRKLMDLVLENSGAERAILFTRHNGRFRAEAECLTEAGTTDLLPSYMLDEKPDHLAESVVHYVSHTHGPVVLADAMREGDFRSDPYIRRHGCRSLLCLPLLNHGELGGLLYLENNLITGAFTPERLEILTMLCSQAAVSLENARLYTDISELSRAYERFVPHDMLNLLHRNSILDVQLGDQVQGEMTALFTDIRSFTTLSEQMTPEENFSFLNEYLGRMSPIIREHNGFVNRYMGDALLAIFPHSADDAVAAGIDMLKRLDGFNLEWQERLGQPLRIGIGINTGTMMMGTVGEANRMEGSILSDAVNIAARLETLTKTYRTPLLISSATKTRLSPGGAFATRFIGDVLLRGREHPVGIFEVFDADQEAVRQLKRELLDDFDAALRAYQVGDHNNAARQFRSLREKNPDDVVSHVLLEQCEQGRPLDGGEDTNPLQQ